MQYNLDSLIAQIRIESEYGPTVVLDRPFAPDASTTAPAALKWLKPRITIVPAVHGINPIVSQPWGAPGPTKWPQVQLGLVAAGAIGLGLLGYGILRAFK